MSLKCEEKISVYQCNVGRSKVGQSEMDCAQVRGVGVRGGGNDEV